jgi:hypothetical protein
MPSTSSTRRRGVTGGAALVSQAYPPYIHHRISSSRADLPATSQPPGATVAVSWVMVKTKTRSKNSSSDVT